MKIGIPSGARVLVTGGAGFVGTNLVKRLLTEGYSVTSIDNYETGFTSNHIDGVEYVNADINNINTHISGEYEIVFHLAALPRIQPSFENPTATFDTNVTGTAAVLEWARHHNARVIYAGSSSRWHNPYRSPYAVSKHIGEELCKMYRLVYGVDVEISRFYNAYGPYEITDGDWVAVIGKWRGQVLRGQPITIVGDGEQRRDFTHVDDIADGLLRIATSNEHHLDAWELGTGCNYSINEVCALFLEHFGAISTRLPDQPGNYRETRRENNDAIECLGWNPTDRLREYIKSL